MEKNLKIEKLSDIVAWADGKIRDGGYNEEKYRSDATTAYCNVKAYELWKIRDVALESMERQTVYTNALKNDIASKDAKIEKLEKEIEGRKECYTALKELVDTKYISIDEHNNIVDALNKEIERLNRYTTNLDKVNQDLVSKVTLLESELTDCKVKNRHQKENLDGINKTLEIRTKEKESLVKVRNNLNKEIEGHESDNARLSEKIIELKKENSYLKKELNETCTRKELDLKGHNRREIALVNELADKNDEIKKLEESIDYYKNQERIRTDQLRATERKVDELWGLVNELKKEKKEGDDYAREGFKLYVKNTLAEAEGDKNEANEVITEAVRSAYAEWGKEQKEKEEETEVNNIPCGEDAIE